MTLLTDPNGKELASLVPRNAEAVNLATDAVFTNPSARTLLVGVAGDIKVDMAGIGTALTLPALAGPFPYAVTKVYKVGTGATGIFSTW